LQLVSSGNGITIKPKRKTSGRDLSALIGMLKHKGPDLSTDELCAPVDYADGNLQAVLSKS
jgi:hypothetical protein